MKSRQQDDIFAEILCKFIANLPRSERIPTRLWYHYEKAHYYYVDHEKHRHNRNKKPLTENERQEKLEFFASLNKIAPPGFQIQPQKLYDDCSYAHSNIPVYGVILVNERQTKVVCVSAVGRLGFPKGKIDEGETPLTCAARECWEEIGYDVMNKLNPYDTIEVEGDTKNTVFFVVNNIKEESVKVLKMLNQFNPQSVTEVDAVVWVPLDDASQPLTKVTRRALQKVSLQLSEKRSARTKFEHFLDSFVFELKNPSQPPPTENPFKSFQLDRKKLLNIFS